MFTFENSYTYGIKKAAKNFDVPFASYSDDVKANILQVGLGRILNDLVASSKTTAEAEAAVTKKLDAWARGEIRAARIGEADPVAAEAMKIAIGKVKKGPKFLAWLVENGLKQSDAEALKELRLRATDAAKLPDIVAEAARIVAAIDAIDIGDDF